MFPIWQGTYWWRYLVKQKAEADRLGVLLVAVPLLCPWASLSVRVTLLHWRNGGQLEGQLVYCDWVFCSGFGWNVCDCRTQCIRAEGTAGLPCLWAAWLHTPSVLGKQVSRILGNGIKLSKSRRGILIIIPLSFHKDVCGKIQTQESPRAFMVSVCILSSLRVICA